MPAVILQMPLRFGCGVAAVLVGFGIHVTHPGMGARLEMEPARHVLDKQVAGAADDRAARIRNRAHEISRADRVPFSAATTGEVGEGAASAERRAFLINWPTVSLGTAPQESQ